MFIRCLVDGNDMEVGFYKNKFNQCGTCLSWGAKREAMPLPLGPSRGHLDLVGIVIEGLRLSLLGDLSSREPRTHSHSALLAPGPAPVSWMKESSAFEQKTSRFVPSICVDEMMM